MVLALLGLDPLQWYLIIMGVCSLMLMITALLGGLGGGDFDVGGDVDVDFDVDTPGVDLDYGEFSGPGISPMSLPIILLFGSSFGALGALMEATDVLNSVVIPFIAAGISVLITAGMFVVLVRVFVKTQASTIVDKEALIGTTGHVHIPISPGATGQILVITEARGRTLLDAVASEEIPRDAVVRITGFVGNAAQVENVGG